MSERNLYQDQRRAKQLEQHTWLNNESMEYNPEDVFNILKNLDMRAALFIMAFESAADEIGKENVNEDFVIKLFNRGCDSVISQSHKFLENLPRFELYINEHQNTDLDLAKELYYDMLYVKAILSDIVIAQKLNKESLIIFIRQKLPELVDSLKQHSRNIGKNQLYLYYRGSQTHKARQDFLKENK